MYLLIHVTSKQTDYPYFLFIICSKKERGIDNNVYYIRKTTRKIIVDNLQRMASQYFSIFPRYHLRPTITSTLAVQVSINSNSKLSF